LKSPQSVSAVHGEPTAPEGPGLMGVVVSVGVAVSVGGAAVSPETARSVAVTPSVEAAMSVRSNTSFAGGFPLSTELQAGKTIELNKKKVPSRVKIVFCPISVNLLNTDNMPCEKRRGLTGSD
jgi:hypothetical protein